MAQNVGPKAESAKYDGPVPPATNSTSDHTGREIGGYVGSALGQWAGAEIGLQQGASAGMGRVGKEFGELIGDLADLALATPVYDVPPPADSHAGMSMDPGVCADPDTLGQGGASVDHGGPQMSIDPSHAGPQYSVDPDSTGWGGTSHAPDPGMSIDPSGLDGGMSHAADPAMSIDPSSYHAEGHY